MKESARLFYRSWQKSDFDTIVALLDDPEIAKGFGREGLFDANDRAKDRISHKNGNEEDGAIVYHFAICLKKTGEVIGEIGIRYDPKTKVQRFGGVAIMPGFREQGYGKEAMAARSEFSFKELGVESIRGGYILGNQASEQLQKSLGFRKTGHELGMDAQRNIVTVINTELTKQDWLKQNQNSKSKEA